MLMPKRVKFRKMHRGRRSGMATRGTNVDFGTYGLQHLAEDRYICATVHSDLPKAGISGVDIERQPNQVHVIINTAKPGIIIGRKGANVNALRVKLQDVTQKKVKIDVNEIAKPEIEATLVAESVAEQMERRISWKRAMKQASGRAIRAGAQGVMITVSGRLGGSEMSRVDSIREGQVPRHTLRANIEYGTAESLTTYGIIGVKVWVYHGEVLPGEEYHSKYANLALE